MYNADLLFSVYHVSVFDEGNTCRLVIVNRDINPVLKHSSVVIGCAVLCERCFMGFSRSAQKPWVMPAVRLYLSGNVIKAIVSYHKWQIYPWCNWVMWKSGLLFDNASARPHCPLSSTWSQLTSSPHRIQTDERPAHNRYEATWRMNHFNMEGLYVSKCYGNNNDRHLGNDQAVATTPLKWGYYLHNIMNIWI